MVCGSIDWIPLGSLKWSTGRLLLKILFNAKIFHSEITQLLKQSVKNILFCVCVCIRFFPHGSLQQITFGFVCPPIRPPINFGFFGPLLYFNFLSCIVPRFYLNNLKFHLSVSSNDDHLLHKSGQKIFLVIRYLLQFSDQLSNPQWRKIIC